MHATTKRESYITVKDHKPQLLNNPKFRLINPTKAELGMVSKQMLEEIITAVKTKTQLLQWKNNDSVINWFNNLRNKDRLLFIQFDVVDFYGSISQVLVESSLTFAARYTPINQRTKNTICSATSRRGSRAKGAHLISPWVGVGIMVRRFVILLVFTCYPSL